MSRVFHSQTKLALTVQCRLVFDPLELLQECSLAQIDLPNFPSYESFGARSVRDIVDLCTAGECRIATDERCIGS